jgi:hypothetical protein
MASRSFTPDGGIAHRPPHSSSENQGLAAESTTLPPIVEARTNPSNKLGKQSTTAQKLAVSHGLRTKSLGLTQTGLDLTFDQYAIHQIYNECIPWAAKRGGFKDVDSLRFANVEADPRFGNALPQSNSRQKAETCKSAKSKKLDHRKTRETEKLVQYGGMRTALQNDLSMLISAQWSQAKDRKNVTEKLWAAGVMDTAQLKELICTKALVGDDLPRSTWFRGFPCELNRRIKDRGGSIFTTATLDHLLNAIEFKELVARKNQGTIQRALSAEEDDGDDDVAESAHWMHNQPSFSKKSRTLAASSRRPLYLNSMSNERKFNEKAWASCDADTPEDPYATLHLKAPMSHVDITYIAISADSALLAACGSDGNVALVYALEHVATLSRHSKAVRHCCFSADKKLLASASEDCTVCVWELSTDVAGVLAGRCVRELSHDSLVRCCCFHPSGQVLCTAGDDLVACLWYIPCWKQSTSGRQMLVSGSSKVVTEHWKFPGSSCTQVLRAASCTHSPWKAMPLMLAFTIDTDAGACACHGRVCFIVCASVCVLSVYVRECMHISFFSIHVHNIDLSMTTGMHTYT